MNLNEWAENINNFCNEKGWNTNIQLGNMIANVHTEISEAWEEIRNNHDPSEIYFTQECPNKPEGFGIELADAIIRILHIAYYYNLDMDYLIALKIAYNKTRPYRHGGKAA